MTTELENLPPASLYKVDDIEVPEDDPWKHDLLGRKAQALKLQRILEPIQQPFVMTLSAPYGMGKSTFFRCWAQDLKNQEIQSVTFNAWETDYSNDAFSAFVSCVLNQLPASNAKTKVKNKALQVGAALLRKTPALLAKVATKHVIGDEAAKDLKNFSISEEDLSDLTESVAAEMFDRQVKIQNAVADFRSTLESVIADELNGEIYIFVDELDRCRPTYAVEVLERIKHIFSVKGVKFVIAIDRKQLQNAVRGVYGAQIDASGYLSKFIDWNHNLSKPSKGQYINYLYDDLFDVGTADFFRENLKQAYHHTTFKSMLLLLAEAYDLSLRKIDRYFTYLKLVALSRADKNSAEVELYLAAFFKCHFPTDYESIINWDGNADFNETRFDAPIRKLTQNLADTNDINTDIYEKTYQIAILIAMMSTPANRNSDRHKIGVSAQTYQKVINLNPRLDQTWLAEFLEKSRYDGIANIRRGLKALEIAAL